MRRVMGGVSGKYCKNRLTRIASSPAKFTFVYTTFRSKTPRVVTVCACCGASDVRYETAVADGGSNRTAEAIVGQ